jgi:hypothetical protein
MDPLTLLSAKKIVSAVKGETPLSIASYGSPVTFRVKVSLFQDAFKFLSDPLLRGSTHPPGALRVDYHGNAAQGIAFKFNINDGYKITQQSSTTSVFTLSARQLEAAENRVSGEMIQVVAVEYDDGSRYFITEPFPDRFLSTIKRVKRNNLEHSNWQPPAFREAFERAGVVLWKPKEPLIEEQQQQPLPPPMESFVEDVAPAPQMMPAVITGKSDMPLGLSVVDTKDLKDAIQMLNDEIDRVVKAGMQVRPRIDSGGHIRINVQVIYQEEL